MKHQKTTHNHEYIVKYYSLELYYEKEKLNHYGYYTKEYTVHSGCTSLLWQIKFNSLKKLRAYLKNYYIKESGISFNTNINVIIKGQKDINRRYYFVVSCPTKPQLDSLYITLKEPKKKNRFRSRRKGFYYDDMYNSGGQGIKDIIMERDHNRFHQY